MARVTLALTVVHEKALQISGQDVGSLLSEVERHAPERSD